ncbi:Hyoscyamine (6S)-dioxygenase [Bertholletia excelsa]
MKASQEYGFFQLTNHGVPEELMQDVLKIGKEFIDLSSEEKLESVQISGDYRLKSSIDYNNEKVHYWRDNFRHPCHPLDEHLQRWPKKPARYRDVVGPFSVDVRRIGMKLLDLIGEGLGLEPGYFEGGLSQGQLMSINHYPPCPDPTLVLGLPKHGDPYLLTLLNQGEVVGLQVLKDETWLTVEPIRNSFIININHMLQVISNGLLKSAEHRVVTNSSVARTTVVSFIHPAKDSSIEPAKSLLNERNLPLYKAFTFEDFIKHYSLAVREGTDPLQPFMMSP